MESSLSLIGMLLQTLIALAAVCCLAYVIFRVVLPRLQLVQSPNGMIRVVERVGLDAKRSLFVVEVAGKWLLVGSSENGVQLVSELNEQEAAAAELEIQATREASRQKIEDLRRNFADVLIRVTKRKTVKGKEDEQPREKKQFLWTNKK